MGKVGRFLNKDQNAVCSLGMWLKWKGDSSLLILPHPGTSCLVLQSLGMWMHWGYFLWAQRPPSSPRFILGRVTGVLQQKPEFSLGMAVGGGVAFFLEKKPLFKEIPLEQCG